MIVFSSGIRISFVISHLTLFPVPSVTQLKAEYSLGFSMGENDKWFFSYWLLSHRMASMSKSFNSKDVHVSFIIMFHIYIGWTKAQLVILIQEVSICSSLSKIEFRSLYRIIVSIVSSFILCQCFFLTVMTIFHCIKMHKPLDFAAWHFDDFQCEGIQPKVRLKMHSFVPFLFPFALRTFSVKHGSSKSIYLDVTLLVMGFVSQPTKGLHKIFWTLLLSLPK